MTNFKLLLLSIVTILGSSSIVNAGLGNFGQGSQPVKLSVYGHTGQDPVSECTSGMDDYSIRTKIAFRLDGDVSLDFPTTFVSQLISDIDVTKTDDSPLSELAIETHPYLDFSSIDYSRSPSINSMLSGGTVPAPPAFLLLMSGLFSRSRRKS